ncbi:MAG: DUF4012 domain-containing protein [Salinibacterium sp.]|nr:MAG: DUF4012 domain-containing protein [Salinibacterium sp.]
MAEPRAKSARSVKRWIFYGLAFVVLAPLLWLGVRAFVAYDALINAQADVGSAKEAIASNSLIALPAIYDDMNDETSLAVSMTSDPVWLGAEHIPVLGPNLTAVREVASTIRGVVVDGVGPVAGEAGDFSLASMRPEHGRIDLDRIESLIPAVDSASAALSAAEKSANDIDTSQTLPPVTHAIEAFRAQLAGAVTSAESAKRVMLMIPVALGSDEPRNYLVVLADNAQDRGNSGAPSSVALVTVDDGSLRVVRSVPTSALHATGPSGVAATPGETEIYGPSVAHSPNAASATPDYPLAAAAMAQSWQQTFHNRVDGVLTVDSTGLEFLVGATGKVELANGATITGSNTAELLQNEKLASGKLAALQSDALERVLGRIIDGAGTTPGYVRAAGQLVNEKRVLLWGARAREQKFIAGSPIAGVLSTDNSAVTTYGVFFTEADGNRLSTSLATSVDLLPTACNPSSGAKSSLKISLSSARSSGTIVEDVVVYSPVRFTATSHQVVGGRVVDFAKSSIDKRTVQRFRIEVPAKGTVILTVRLAEGADSASAISEVRTTSRWTVTPLTIAPCS